MIWTRFEHAEHAEHEKLQLNMTEKKTQFYSRLHVQHDQAL